MYQTWQRTGAAWRNTCKQDFDSVRDFLRRTTESASDAFTTPDQATRHFRESHLQFLKGVRAVLDRHIDRMSSRA